MERSDVLEEIRLQFQKRIITSFEDIEILKAELGNQEGMISAAAYARMALSDKADGKTVGKI